MSSSARAKLAALVEESVGKERERTSVATGLPRDRQDLHPWLLETFGVVLPDQVVIPGHTPPAEAFALSFFAEAPVIVWKASRGLGGKSFMLALLGLAEAVAGMEVVSLGGSFEQSARVVEYMHGWAQERASIAALVRKMTETGSFIKLHGGGEVKALTASTKSARGPHPQRLNMDELDEVAMPILRAALGQPMGGRGFDPSATLSSTHQYPDGPMSWALAQSVAKGWAVAEWSWRETHRTEANPSGWLTDKDVEAKRSMMTAQDWSVEVELQEPSIEGRAIQSQAVELAFREDLGLHDGHMDELLIMEDPDELGTYVVGADWAKRTDYTVMTVFRVEGTDPVRLRRVAYLKTGRRPYPQMVQMLDHLVALYGATGAHDATGVGDGLDDYMAPETQEAVEGVTLSGKVRRSIFTSYITAVEAGQVYGPRVLSSYKAHLYTTHGDLYLPSGHPPDEVVADALAHHGSLAGLKAPGQSTYEKDTAAVKPGARMDGGAKTRALKRARTRRR